MPTKKPRQLMSGLLTFLVPKMIPKMSYVIIFTSLIGDFCWASSQQELAPSIPYIECFNQAAAEYGVELPLLIAIAEKESGFNPKALNTKNLNGSFDIGIMQINSYWIKGPYVKSHFYEPCFNIKFGAYVLSDSLARWGNNWKGVGKYNARTPSKGYVYTTDLYPRYIKYVNLLSKN